MLFQKTLYRRILTLRVTDIFYWPPLLCYLFFLGAKHWFVDGTFKVVRSPFVQLFSVHAFVRQGDSLKQISLVYFLMSGKTTKDYEAIFRTLLRILLHGNIGVQSITLDFEAAVWVALKKVLPSVSLKGCLFHWSQTIWRKIQQLGLVTIYLKKDSAYKFCRRSWHFLSLLLSLITLCFAF